VFILIAEIAASLAMLLNGVPQDFLDCIDQGEPVVMVDTFVGKECEAQDGERWYAGLVWWDDTILLETGP
jgi:hypothetical protein